jgi:nicotinic acid phosphoribosyltransferase
VAELREQLEETRKLRFHKSELIWLAGNTFYGKRGIFEPAFLEWLERDFRLSDYELSVEDGQIALRFSGLWTETTLWEIYALSAIDELKTRASLKRLSEFELDILYARAKTRLWEKMERLRGVPRLNVSDFGTRRRHSFLWQEYVVKAMSDVLGASFAGARIPTWLTSTIWRRLAPMRTSCRWRWRRWPQRRGVADGAVPDAGVVAADLPGRVADSAAGYVWDDAVS